MMTEEELLNLFPHGAQVIPRAEDDRSFKALVGTSEGTDEFRLFDTPGHHVALSRDLKPLHDGWLTTEYYGKKKYFLRPLTEDQKIEF